MLVWDIYEALSKGLQNCLFIKQDSFHDVVGESLNLCFLFYQQFGFI